MLKQQLKHVKATYSIATRYALSSRIVLFYFKDENCSFLCPCFKWENGELVVCTGSGQKNLLFNQLPMKHLDGLYSLHLHGQYNSWIYLFRFDELISGTEL